MSRSVRALRLAASIAAVLLITVAYSLLVRVNPTTVVLSYATIDATVSSLTGVTHGVSADGQTLTYRRVS